jgi:transcriptional regulator with XRE-family HTH domain
MALSVRSCQAAAMPKGAQKPDPALAAVIRRLREDRGESQEALAYRSHMAGGTLARIELCQASPAWVTVRDIAKALDIGIADLATLVESEQHANEGS